MKGNPPKPDPRDRDLITVDSILGDEALDKLWDWYCMATANNLDPQMVFVKFVNSIRKPYVEKLEHQQRTFFPYGGGSMATPSGYTPSEAGTVIGDYEPRTDSHYDPFNLIEAPLIHLEHKPDSELEPHDHDHVDSDGHDLGPSTEKAKDMLGSIVIPPRILQPTRIAIKAADFPNSFVQLKGDRITSFLSGGGGSAHVAGGISDTEIFELERLEHGIVAFKSIKHHNVYLRADPQGLKPGEFRMWGGGVVNCQYSCGKHERFRITKAGEGGQVAIEPEEFPGTYLRVNGMGSDGINLQGTRSGWERFFLVLVI